MPTSTSAHYQYIDEGDDLLVRDFQTHQADEVYASCIKEHRKESVNKLHDWNLGFRVEGSTFSLQA